MWLRLFFLKNFPVAKLIQGDTLIPDSRVRQDYTAIFLYLLNNLFEIFSQEQVDLVEISHIRVSLFIK